MDSPGAKTRGTADEGSPRNPAEPLHTASCGKPVAAGVDRGEQDHRAAKSRRGVADAFRDRARPPRVLVKQEPEQEREAEALDGGQCNTGIDRDPDHTPCASKGKAVNEEQLNTRTAGGPDHTPCTPKGSGDSACENSSAGRTQSTSSRGPLKDVSVFSVSIKTEPLDYSAESVLHHTTENLRGARNEDVDNSESVSDDGSLGDIKLEISDDSLDDVKLEISEDSLEDDSDEDEDDDEDHEIESLPVYFQSDCSDQHGTKDLLRRKDEQECVCCYCSEVFDSASRCREHEETEHSKESVKQEVSSDLRKKRVSIKQDRNTKHWKCKICWLTFSTSSQLASHRSGHKITLNEQTMLKLCKGSNGNKKPGWKDRPCKCTECGRPFRNAKYLKSHMRVHSDEKPFTCDLCPSAFVRPADLKRHKKTHTGEKAFKCQLCESAFADSCKLKIHMRIHTGERPYKCERCGEGFSQPSQYARHMRVHNGEKPFQCPYCPSAFTMTSDYRRHLKIHTGERPFICQFCPASFPEAKNLRIHMRTHTGEKPYKCEICNSMFAQAANLARHIKTHSGEKPARCEICSSAFADKYKLQVHMRSHSGEKPYRCQVCPAAFATSSSLNRHVMVLHSGEKPFKCPHCPAVFALMTKLRVHAVCHSFDGPFKCQWCSASFRNAYGLTVHSHVHE